MSTTQNAIDEVLAPGSVTTTALAANAATYSKMQLLSQTALLGNSAGANGPVQEITVGTGLSLTGGVLSATASGGGSGMTWQATSAGSVAPASNNGYVATGSSQTAFPLPSGAAVGDKYRFAAYGTGGFTITQATGQQVRFGNATTTTGAAGSITSQNQGDALEIVCVVAGAGFMVMGSMGNLTVA